MREMTVPGPAPRLVAQGIYFGEGPRWHDGRLWFSDFYARAVRSLGPDAELRTELELDDQPSGLGWLPDGRLLVVAMRGRRVLRRDPAGLVVHAELAGVARHLANDMVVDAAGRAYVGNFGFDLHGERRARGPDSVNAGHPTTTLARVDADGSVHLAAAGMHFPNGMAITPDGRTLIVAETLAMRLTAFDVGAAGELTNRRVWAPLGTRLPDGISLDADGHVWVANAAAAECVLVAEGGAVHEVIETGQRCFACMLGGAAGRTLYMLTAPSSLPELLTESPRGRLLAAEVGVGRAGLP
jgi:sugar lactone lactonase YvrE